MTVKVQRMRRSAGTALASMLAAITLFMTGSVIAQGTEVLARVNGAEITSDDYATALELYASQLGDMPEEAKRSAIVDFLIEQRLAVDAARKAGLADNPFVQRRIAFFEAQTLRSALVDQRLDAEVTEDKVRQAYDRQVAFIPPVEERRISHILLSSEQEASEVMAELGRGADFGELARNRSKDEASKANGGDLGWIAAGQTLAELDEAASKLQPGQHSQPVASAFGFHVVKLTEQRTRPAPTFEQVAPQIRTALESEATQKLLAELRNGAQVEKLVPDVAPPGSGDDHGHAHE
jgi:peptidyl-prolyl cis-trans isomerase C